MSEMAEEFRWIHGQAHIQGVVERICPNAHVTQNQWNDRWNEWFVDSRHSYPYISDYECCFNYPVVREEVIAFYDQERWQNLQDAKQQGMNIRITNLAHFTEEEVAENIIRSGGFEGGEKKIKFNEDDGNNITVKLSWWSPKFMQAEQNQVRDTLGRAIEPFLGEYDDPEILKEHFATSDAFKPNPQRYGNFYFQYGIGELCQHYENYIGQDVQYKILGTYAYKQEIMHAVLVCSQAVGQFAAYPDVLTPAEDVNNQAVVTRDEDGGWLWKPQATSTKIRRLQAHLQPYPKYRRWEHVAFAFHTPGDEAFNIPELRQHLHQL